MSEGDDSISVTSYAIEKVQVPKLISKQTNYYLMTDLIFVEINELGIASIIIEEHTNIIIFLKVYSLLFLNKNFMHALLSLFLFR